MASNSGADQTYINQFERALSSDLNQLQHFASRHVQQTLARLIGDRYSDTGVGTDEQRGVASTGVQGSAPMAGDVYGGLMVRITATDLLVTPGVLCAFDHLTPPDPVQDSNYTFIDDPGVTTTGVLPFVANPGPGRRIDVVECSIISAVNTLAVVDIFDVPTQTFVPVLSPKTLSARLFYRIRQGTPGGGYPGSVTGYLPLAIASHASGSTSFANVHFWDVRPLLQDRTRGPFARKTTSRATRINRRTYAAQPSGATDNILMGDYDIESANNIYVVQGLIKNSLPGASNAAELLITDPAILAPGVTLTGDKWMYVVSLFPSGLPRWVAYETVAGASGERLPDNVMGIMALSNGPTTYLGSMGLESIPTLSGLLGTAPGVCVALVYLSTAAFPNAFIRNHMTADGGMSWDKDAFSASLRYNGTLVASTATTATIQFPLGNPGDSMMPSGVQRLRYRMELEGTLSSATSFRLSSIELRTGSVVLARPSDMHWQAAITGSPHFSSVDFQFELPAGLIQVGQSVSSLTLNFVLHFSSGSYVSTARSLDVISYSVANS